MNRFLKGFIVFLILIVLLAMVRTITIAQVQMIDPVLDRFPPSPDPNISTSSNLSQILVDDFEYSDSLYNHGWEHPPYQVYGYGIGYTNIYTTVFDLQNGSWVLDCYGPSSIFLIETPYFNHPISKDLFTSPGSDNPDHKAGINTTTNPIINFEFRLPLGIEPWDIFELDVIGKGNDEEKAVTVRIIPVRNPSVDFLGPFNSIEGMHDGMNAAVSGFDPPGQLQVTVTLGREMLDGSWNAVWVDLVEAVKAAVEVFDDIDQYRFD